MNAQLKPCPFCGAKLEYRAPRSTVENYYEHPKGDCFLALSGGLGDPVTVWDHPEAIAAWNQRAEHQPLTKELYNELLFAVGNKYPNETRQQTALRYIRQAETCDSQSAKKEAAQNTGAKP